MENFAKLLQSPFVQTVFDDASKVWKKFNVEPGSFEWPESAPLLESQFYVQRLGFHVSHALTWFKQLDLAIEFLSNYEYSKKQSSNRADHLIYNVENYLIRLNSVYDRTLQLTNSTFHLCLGEDHVRHAIILNNYKIAHRPAVQAALRAIKKKIEPSAQARHELVHKHSLLDEDLRKVEMLYLNDDGLGDTAEKKGAI